MLIYSIGSGQVCSGPLNILINGTVSGSALTVDQLHSDIYCLGMDEGAITIDVTGGTPQYHIMWSTGDTTRELHNLEPGMYSVTVMDANECMKTATIEVIEVDALMHKMDLARQDGCGQCYLKDGIGTYLYQESEYMVHVFDVNDSIDIGSIEVCIDLHKDPVVYEKYPYLKRSWKIYAEPNESYVTLYMDEFELLELTMSAGFFFNSNDLKSANLFVTHFAGGQGTMARHKEVNRIENVNLRKFDNLHNVWSVEFPVIPTYATNGFYIGSEINNVLTIVSEVSASIINAIMYIQPNPTRDWIELHVEKLDHFVDGQVIITNVQGQKIYEESFFNERLRTKRINMTHVPPGVYFLTVQFSDLSKPRVFKFVKI